jgi:hypothetical protein
MKSLQKKDTHTIPECNKVITNTLPALANNPVLSLIQSDKTGQWLPMHINDCIVDMQVHINQYCTETPSTKLDSI